MPKVGYRHTDESRAKMSAAVRAANADPKKHAEMLERKAGPEYRAALSRAFKGRTVSAESRARMSVAQRKRRPASAETRAKIGQLSRRRFAEMSSEDRERNAAQLRTAANDNRQLITAKTVQRHERNFWKQMNQTTTNELGCWLTPIVRLNAQGYGPYRSVYRRLVGPIPDGMHLDHLCRKTPCVNPDHLEPVTPEENHRRAWVHVTAFHCETCRCRVTPLEVA